MLLLKSVAILLYGASVMPHPRLARQVAGTLNTLGWSIAVIYLFFAIGFVDFLVRSPKPSLLAAGGLRVDRPSIWVIRL